MVQACDKEYVVWIDQRKMMRRVTLQPWRVSECIIKGPCNYGLRAHSALSLSVFPVFGYSLQPEFAKGFSISNPSFPLLCGKLDQWNAYRNLPTVPSQNDNGDGLVPIVRILPSTRDGIRRLLEATRRGRPWSYLFVIVHKLLPSMKRVYEAIAGTVGIL